MPQLRHLSHPPPLFLPPSPPTPRCALVYVKAKVPLTSSFPLPSIFVRRCFYHYFFPLVIYIVNPRLPVCWKRVSRTLTSTYLIFIEIFTEDISPAQSHTVLTMEPGLAKGGHLLGHSNSAKLLFVLKQAFIILNSSKHNYLATHNFAILDISKRFPGKDQ